MNAFIASTSVDIKVNNTLKTTSVYAVFMSNINQEAPAQNLKKPTGCDPSALWSD